MICLFVLSQRAKLNLPDLHAQARLQNDIKATKTIALTIAAYFFSYVPAIVYAVVGNKEESQADSWFGFFAWYAVSFSSAVNPIIYYLRTSRFRSAFSQFMKDPFGTSDFKEKKSCRVQGAKKRILKGVGTARNKGEKELSGSVAQEKYHGERRNGILALSIEAMDTQLCVFAAGQSIMNGRGKWNKGEAFYSMSCALSCPNSSNRPPHQLIEGGEVCVKTENRTVVKKTRVGPEGASEDGNKERCRQKGLEEGSRKAKHASSVSTVHPLETNDSEETGKCAEEILAYCIEEETSINNILGKRRNAITLAWSEP